MKFYFILLVTVILSTGLASAQHVNFGIKGGLNAYTINSNGPAEYNVKPGFHVGILGHVHLANNFALQPELVYSRQGTRMMTGDSHSNYNLDYLNIPVLFQYMFDNGFRLQAGPQLGVLVNANRRHGDMNVNHKDDFRPLDLGATLGVSYVHPPTGFGVDARYNVGLNNINANAAYNSFNRGLQVGVFYLFKHKS
jgi:hypothetical protein